MNDNHSPIGKIAALLSEEAIRTEPPGPRLDGWVAKYVLPFVRVRTEGDLRLPYSTDIAVVWPLLESLLGETGGTFESHRDGWSADFGADHWRIRGRGEAVSASAPEAICKAALLDIYFYACRMRGVLRA